MLSRSDSRRRKKSIALRGVYLEHKYACRPIFHLVHFLTSVLRAVRCSYCYELCSFSSRQRLFSPSAAHLCASGIRIIIAVRPILPPTPIPFRAADAPRPQASFSIHDASPSSSTSCGPGGSTNLTSPPESREHPTRTSFATTRARRSPWWVLYAHLSSESSLTLGHPGVSTSIHFSHPAVLWGTALTTRDAGSAADPLARPTALRTSTRASTPSWRPPLANSYVLVRPVHRSDSTSNLADMARARVQPLHDIKGGARRRALSS